MKTFDQLLKENKRYIYRVVSRTYQTDDKELMDDLLQIAYISYYKAYQAYDHNKNDNFNRFAAGIIVKDLLTQIPKLTNTIEYHHMLKEKPENTLSINTPTYDDFTIEDELESNDKPYEINTDVLRHFLSTLKPKHQELIKMAYFEGKSINTIAEIKKKTPEAIGSSLKKILLNIQEIVSKDPVLRNKLRELL